MRIFSSYLSRFLGMRVIAVLFALSALLVMKELIENVESLLDRRGSVLDLFVFLRYRVPTVVESIIPVRTADGDGQHLAARLLDERRAGHVALVLV